MTQLQPGKSGHRIYWRLGRSIPRTLPAAGVSRLVSLVKVRSDFSAEKVTGLGCGRWYKRGTEVRQRGGTNGLPEHSADRVQWQSI